MSFYQCIQFKSAWFLFAPYVVNLNDLTWYTVASNPMLDVLQ